MYVIPYCILGTTTLPQSIRVFFTKFTSHHIKSVQAATWIIAILHKTFNIIGSNLLYTECTCRDHVGNFKF